MRIEDLILCLSGELLTLPDLILETINQEEEASAIIRSYLRGEATYQQVVERIAALC